MMAGAKSAVLFHPNTTHYRSHFALKTIIQLVSEQEAPSSRKFQLDFGPVWSDICQMLRWYGANQVGKLWAAPDTLMEVQFTSDKALKKFLQSKRKVETAMAEIMTERLRATKPQDPSTAFRASTALLLVTPNDTTGTTEFRPVELANRRNCVSLYIKSKIAELPTEPETALKIVPEDLLAEDDLPELLKLLYDVVDWYGLGLILGIPPYKLQMIESDLSGVPAGRTLRLLSCVLVEWMQNHQEATWSTLVHALSSIGKRPSARRIAHEYGVHVPDESVLEDLSPEQSEKLQQILEEIKRLVSSQSSDTQLVKIQHAIEEAQQKKQLTLETFGSILKDTISKVKVLLAQKENLEKQIDDKEQQLQQLREGQSAAASSLKQKVSELKQQLLETDQQLNTARVQHSNVLLKKSTEMSALTDQTRQLMSEKDALVADLGSKLTLIQTLQSSSTTLTQLSANLQLNLDMALQQQQRLTSQIQQQQEQHEREVAALREKLQEQQKRDEQHSRSPEALIILEQLNNNALKQLASAMEMGAESQGEGKDSWQYRQFAKSSAEVMEKLANVPLAGRIADKLSAAGIIGEYVNQLAHIHAPGVTEVDRARPIIAALKDKIQHDVQIYHSFRGILLSLGADSDTALYYLAEKEPTATDATTTTTHAVTPSLDKDGPTATEATTTQAVTPSPDREPTDTEATPTQAVTPSPDKDPTTANAETKEDVQLSQTTGHATGQQRITIRGTKWLKSSDAPQGMERGAAVSHGNMAYFNPASSTKLYCYESPQQQWRQLPDCPSMDSALVMAEGRLTTVGGRDQRWRQTNSLASLTGENEDSKWVELLPRMPKARSHLAAVCRGRNVIVIGGYVDDGDRIVTTVEILDTELRQWSSAASLPHPMRSASITVCEDLLYLLGGLDQNDGTVSVLTSSITDLLHQQQETANQSVVWRQAADAPYYYSTAVSVGGQLLAIGGYAENGKLTSAIVAYNPTSDTWQDMGHMATPRYRPLVAVLPSNQLIAAGGFGGKTKVEIGDVV